MANAYTNSYRNRYLIISTKSQLNEIDQLIMHKYENVLENVITKKFRLEILSYISIHYHFQERSISVVSKYSLDRVLTREFLHFDTRTRLYSSSFHKTSKEWGEF